MHNEIIKLLSGRNIEIKNSIHVTGDDYKIYIITSGRIIRLSITHAKLTFNEMEKLLPSYKCYKGAHKKHISISNLKLADIDCIINEVESW